MRDHSNETVSSRAESEPAVDLLRVTVNRLMGERDALAGALREVTELAVAKSPKLSTHAYIARARAALAQLDSVAPPLTSSAPVITRVKP